MDTVWSKTFANGDKGEIKDTGSTLEFYVNGDRKSFCGSAAPILTKVKNDSRGLWLICSTKYCLPNDEAIALKQLTDKIQAKNLPPKKEYKLNPAWKNYNDLVNEAGEGYNPHQKWISA